MHRCLEAYDLGNQGPPVAFTWRVIATCPPPDSACVGSRSGNKVIAGSNGGDTLI
ncbi:MAG: hypothetical protein WBP64_11675 [Nitrososphaeraceae archaeon]